MRRACAPPTYGCTASNKGKTLAISCPFCSDAPNGYSQGFFLTPWCTESPAMSPCADARAGGLLTSSSSLGSSLPT